MKLNSNKNIGALEKLQKVGAPNYEPIYSFYKKEEKYKCKTLSNFYQQNKNYSENLLTSNINKSPPLQNQEKLKDKRTEELELNNNIIYEYLSKNKSKLLINNQKFRKVFVIQDGIFVLNQFLIPGAFLEVTNHNYYSKFKKDRMKYYFDFLSKCEKELNSNLKLVSIFLHNGTPVFDLYDIPNNDIFIYVCKKN